MDREKVVLSYCPPELQDVRTITYPTCTIAEALPKITNKNKKSSRIEMHNIYAEAIVVCRFVQRYINICIIGNIQILHLFSQSWTQRNLYYQWKRIVTRVRFNIEATASAVLICFIWKRGKESSTED